MLLEKVRAKIDSHKIISFDLYDTLICRNVRNPEDIFSLVEIRYNSLYPKKNKIINFKADRIAAYKKAYEKLKAKCKLNNIYDELNNYSEDEKVILKNLEIEFEKKICTVNLEMQNIYNYAREKGKVIIIVSDMYLPQNVIKDIVLHCGITGFNKLFVSCEYGVSKINGGLFELCFKYYNVSSQEMLHFGDGIKNDVVRAFQKGIKPVWVIPRLNLNYDNDLNLDEESKVQYSIQQAFISNNIGNVLHPVEKLGFEVFGPLVFGFCRWLHNLLHSHRIERVFFLAREGLLFKTIYEMMYPEEFVPLQYLYVSRKSLVAPTYWIEPEYESVIKSIAKSKEIDVSTLIERWGIDPRTCHTELRKLGIDLSMRVEGHSLIENSTIKSLYELLKERIIASSKEKYELLKRYLEQESFGGRNAIVDIGWNGGMQNAFCKIATKWAVPTDIYGYYIGINTLNLGVNLKNTYGFVYDANRAQENRYYIYSFAGPLELSLTAPHDTTIGYIDKDGRVIPEFASGEYIKEDGSFKAELRYTFAVQNGIKTYVNLFIQQNLDFFKSSSSESSFRNCRMFGLSPRMFHLSIFSQFGANDLGVEQHFVNPKYKRLIGNKNFLSGFWTSTWKSGYLKMIFKIPFPYYKIYTYMRKRVN